MFVYDTLQLQAQKMYNLCLLLTLLKCRDAAMVICLKRGANDMHTIQLMPLPPRHLFA